MATALLDLPLELITVILTYLTWKDVLRIRQTSKELYEASKAHPIWLCLVRQDLETSGPRLIRPEKELVHYSAAELERLLLRYQSFDKGWIEPNESPIPNRSFVIDGQGRRPGATHLVQGGRWLLSAACSGAEPILYYDLDTFGLAGRVLIPANHDVPAASTVWISVDEDTTSELLTFNVALLIEPTPTFFDIILSDPSAPRDPPLSIRTIQVWNVTGEIDEDGHVIGLKAYMISSFPEGRARRSHVACFTLYGADVGYLIVDETNAVARRDAVCVDWAQANGTSLRYDRGIIPEVDFTSMHILPQDRVLALSPTKLVVYFLNTACLVTDPLPIQQYLDPSEPDRVVVAEEHGISLLSRPYIVRHATRFVALESIFIKGIHIPHRTAPWRHIPYVVTLHEGQLEGIVKVLGYHHALFSDGTAGARTVKYAWPGDPASSVHSIGVARKVVRLVPHTPRMYVFSALDEGSGRLVVSDFGVAKREGSITDFTLPHNNLPSW